MEILVYALGQMQANCYVVCRNAECLVVDPGDEANFVLEELLRRGLQPVALVVTHGHFDHVMAAGEIQASFKIPFYVSSFDQFLLTRLESTAKHFLGYDPVILPIQNMQNILEINHDFDSFDLQVIETPGHTPGSICLYNKNEQILFTGDTLFNEGIGRYDFSYSDKKQLLGSIKKLLKLPGETKVYPGHGLPTTIAKSQEYLSVMLV